VGKFDEQLWSTWVSAISLADSTDSHRRVLAVLRYLRGSG